MKGESRILYVGVTVNRNHLSAQSPSSSSNVEKLDIQPTEAQRSPENYCMAALPVFLHVYTGTCGYVDVALQTPALP